MGEGVTMSVTKREEVLHGATYCATLDSEKPMFVTVNESDGRPFEVFIRIDDPDSFEWMLALTVVISRCLRAGEPLASIAEELQEIYSPVTKHFIPGGGGECHSLVARLGHVLKHHSDTYGH